MPNISELKTSRFLTKEDVGAGKLLTIKGWIRENVAMQGQPEELKYCLEFHEVDKPLVLNVTRGDVVAEICKSDEMDDWTGTKIVLFTDPNVMNAGKRVGGIAVRAPRNIAPMPKPAPPSPAPKPRPPAPEPAPVAAEAEPGPDDDVPF